MFTELERGKPTYCNWQETLDYAIESKEPEWVIEILKLYVAEFGDKEYTVIIDW